MSRYVQRSLAPRFAPGGIGIRCLLAGVLTVLACGMAFGQVSTGTLTVNVLDPSGAIVPSAQVTITHVSTELRRQGVSNESGIFFAPFLPVGSYNVVVESPGFKVANVAGLDLRVGQSAEITARLELGQISEVVEVSSAAALLETTNATLGQVIENKQILDLPLNGRNPFALGLLAGNTTQVQGMGTNMTFIGGGGRFSSMDITLDGVDNNTTVTNGSIGRNGVAYTPSVDAVQEFKVQTNGFSAEYGHAAGTVVNATLKSGTNEFHGTLFEFLRNDKLDATNFLTNAAGLTKAPFRQNQYGGAIGGPILSNRTFFFFDYQGTRQRTSAGTSIINIPPTAFRNGDFSKLGTTIYNPQTRLLGPSGTVVTSPFANNLIPQNQINPTSSAITDLVPQPNFGAPDATSRNFFAAIARPTDMKSWDIRLDQKLSNMNNMFFRASSGTLDSPRAGAFGDGFIGGGTVVRDLTHQFVLADTAVLSPTMVNEARFGYLRHDGSVIGNAPEGVDFAQKNNLALFPFPSQGFPGIYFLYSGLWSSPAAFNTWGGGNSNLNIENRFQASDTLSWSRGAHNLKLGGDWRRKRFDTLKGDPFFGGLLFGSIFSSSPQVQGSGSPFADFLMGYPAGVQATQMLAWGGQRETYVGTFVQDDWKVSQRLTLNLGVRYELFTQPYDAHDRGGIFNPETGQFQVPGQNGYSRSIVKGDHNNIAPRVGFAYQLSSKMTLRAGYGLYYGLRDQNQEVTQFSGSTPNIPNLIFPAISASTTVAPPVTINTPIEVVPADPTLSGFSLERPYNNLVRFSDINNSRNPGLHQFNFNIEYQPAEDWLVQISYSGTRGFDLASAYINLNQISYQQALSGLNSQADRPFPYINAPVNAVSSIGNSIYNAGNFKLEKRYSQGLTLLANYTWQKNIETKGTGPSSYTQIGNSQALDSTDLDRERSVAPIDVTHTISGAWSYELPWGPGKAHLQEGLLSHLLGGWQLSGIATARTGFPTDIFTNVQASVFNSFNVPDRVIGQDLLLPNAGVDGYFNPKAFSIPGTDVAANGKTLQRIGNSSRRVARGPGLTNMDFSIARQIDITERYKLQFRSEFFNLTNTPSFTLPSPTNSSMTCIGKGTGTPCDAGNANFGKLSNGTVTGRQIQFGLKFLF